MARYWTLPQEDLIHFKKRADYVDCFRDLFETAVRDRMRTDRIAFLMSGGLDSTSVAATATALSRLQSSPVDFEAYTVVYDELIADRERRFSQAATDSLQVCTNYLVADNYSLYQRLGDRRLCTPEPYHEPFAALSADLFDQIAMRHRVVLAGYGGDAALCPSLAYFDRMLKESNWSKLLFEAIYYLFSRCRVPKFGIRQWFLSRHSTASEPPTLPGWLNPDFAKRYDPLSRWREAESAPKPIHPVRPEAYELLVAPHWQQIFESLDAEATQVACEVRNPFFDRRLLEYILRVPPIPFCVQKDILRGAMRSLLPVSVRRRRKEPLRGNPYLARLQRGDLHFWNYHFDSEDEIALYVNTDSVPPVVAENDMNSFWMNTRPISLDNWLKNRHSFAGKSDWEVAYAKG